jgi:hypothetical protein
MSKAIYSNANERLIELATVNAPAVFKIKVVDYHEFDYIKKMMKTALNICYNFVETGCDRYYHAVFYAGEQPIELIKNEKERLAVK